MLFWYGVGVCVDLFVYDGERVWRHLQSFPVRGNSGLFPGKWPARPQKCVFLMIWSSVETFVEMLWRLCGDFFGETTCGATCGDFLGNGLPDLKNVCF